MLRRRNLMFSVGLENYVKDSLNLWLDGIWNAGKGVHSDTLTSWVDLSGNCQPTPLGTGNTAEENCISSDGTPYGRVTVPDLDPINLNTFTLEVLFQRNGHETVNQVIIGRNYTKSYYINIAKGELSCWTGGKSTIIYRKTGADKYLVQLTHTGSSLNAWLNGERAISNKANTLLTDPVQLNLFGYRGNNTTFDGSIFAVRLHRRILTDVELAQNYEVDKQRFGLAAK